MLTKREAPDWESSMSQSDRLATSDDAAWIYRRVRRRFYQVGIPTLAGLIGLQLVLALV